MILFGLTESSVLTGHSKTADDNMTLSNILTSLSIPIATDIKLFRLRLGSTRKPRFIKVIFQYTNTVDDKILNFTSAVWSGLQALDNFHIVKDRTFLEREILDAVYAELNRRKQSEESNLVISYVKGIPMMIRVISKNGIPGSSSRLRPQHGFPQD